MLIVFSADEQNGTIAGERNDRAIVLAEILWNVYGSSFSC